jgi:hypothetical protein
MKKMCGLHWREWKLNWRLFCISSTFISSNVISSGRPLIDGQDIMALFLWLFHLLNLLLDFYTTFHDLALLKHSYLYSVFFMSAPREWGLCLLPPGIPPGTWTSMINTYHPFVLSNKRMDWYRPFELGLSGGLVKCAKFSLHPHLLSHNLQK